MHNSFSDFPYGFTCVSLEVRFGTLIGVKFSIFAKWSSEIKSSRSPVLALKSPHNRTLP